MLARCRFTVSEEITRCAAISLFVRCCATRSSTSTSRLHGRRGITHRQQRMTVGQQWMLDGYGGPLEHRSTEKAWLSALQGNMLPAEDAEAASHGADRIIGIEARRLIAKPADCCERR